MTSATEYLFSNAWVDGMWQQDVRVAVSATGEISAVTGGHRSDDATVIPGLALPGIPNTHCHAFQRALSGLTEFRDGHNDNFWTWRETMYRLAQLISTDDLYNIASQLYMEMLKAGYTSVTEFHYLHHRPDGSFHDDPAEMSLALVAAAHDTGIALTFLPVLYMHAGFDKRPPQQRQLRFCHSAPDYCRLLERLAVTCSDRENMRTGCAFHSLRAVPPGPRREVLSHVKTLDDSMPVHIHVAEQEREVEDCLEWSGKRPVQWLLDEHDLDTHWCLVHATHMDEAETNALAESGAVVSLCPTTEANLGDGLFPLAGFLAAGGTVAIGSDSNTSVSPVEELRWLEYGQRLLRRQRNIAVLDSHGSTGAALLRRVCSGGAQAAGRNTGNLAVGNQADIIVLDDQSATLAGIAPEKRLDAFVFSGNNNTVRDVLVGGRHVIRDKRHEREEAITTAFIQTVHKLGRGLAESQA